MMTDLQKQIELLEEQGNNAELLGLLACDPDTRARNRLLADKLRLLAIELRYDKDQIRTAPPGEWPLAGLNPTTKNPPA